MQGSKSPFIGSLPSFQRNSQEKPDLLKGSFNTLRKQSGPNPNIKNDASNGNGVSTSGDNMARYKVSGLEFLKGVIEL